MSKIINIMNYRLRKAIALEEAIAVLENANAAAREAEAEARKSIKFKLGNYYLEGQKYADGDPLAKEAIKVIRRTQKTITFLYIPVPGMDEESCKIITRKVRVGSNGEWIQVSKFAPIISASCQ